MNNNSKKLDSKNDIMQYTDNKSCADGSVLKKIENIQSLFLKPSAEQAEGIIDGVYADGEIDLEQKLAALYALHARIEECISTLFDKLPSEAPELWLNRTDRSETPIAFSKRVYGRWMQHGLTQATIRRADKSLYMAIHAYLKNNDWPDDFRIPTLEEYNTSLVNKVLPELEEHPCVKEFCRLRTIVGSRKARSRKRASQSLRS